MPHRHRRHSIELTRPVAQSYLMGESLKGLAREHDISHNLIREWVRKYEAGAFDAEARRRLRSTSTRPRSPSWSARSASSPWSWNS
jgi:transposase-like protein